MEIKNLIKELKRKNPVALESLINNYSNLIFKIANGILNDREISKEIVNDVILKVWSNIDKFDNTYEKFPAWIMVISRCAAIDRLRKEAKHIDEKNIDDFRLSKKECICNNFIITEKLTEVKNEIDNMNDTDREIFLRKFYDDKSSAQISKELGLSEKFINLRIFRGRKKLKEKFGVERG